MPIVQLADIIKQRKAELGLTINEMFLASGVGTHTITIILTGEDVSYSSIKSLLKSLNLSMTIGKC